MQTCGQYFQFNQNNFNTQRISPASPANSDYAGMSYIYRNQGTAGNVVINSHLLSGSFPLITSNSGKRWGGVGITMMDDRSSPIYQQEQASFSFALNNALNRFQSIAFGIQSRYEQHSVDLAALKSSQKYLKDRFATPSDNTIGSAEINQHNMSASAGAEWQFVDAEGVRRGYLSASLFDFYSPVAASQILNENNPVWVTAANFRAFRNGNLSIFPEAIYTKGGAQEVLNIGMITRCDVKIASIANPYYVNVLTKYLSTGSGIFGLQYHNENFSLGASYEVLLTNDKTSNIGAFEIGLEIRRLVRPEFKNKVLKRKLGTLQHQIAKTKTRTGTTTSQERSSQVEFDSVDHTTHKTFSEKLFAKRDSALLVKRSSKPIEIDRYVLKVNFGFNSTKMDSTAMRYLDELADALKKDLRFRLKLTGHTDNIGTPSANYQLSLHRANAVKAYLVQRGLASHIIKTDGRGMAQPLNENKTEQQRARNRRVEFQILIQE